MLTYSGSVHPLTTYLSIHPFSQSPLHLTTFRPYTHLSRHQFIHPFIPLPIHPFICLFTYLSPYIYPSLDPPVHWPMHPYIYPSIHPFIHQSICSPIKTIHPPTYLYISVHSSGLSVCWPIINPPIHTTIGFTSAHGAIYPPTHTCTHYATPLSTHPSAISPFARVLILKKIEIFL